MKVFISWSGERSKAVAEALRYWLPKVIQAVHPWMSANDIEKGSGWRAGLSSELEQSNIGIICLTPENLESPWIHFEAGALSKQQQDTRVCTFLLDLDPIDVREPLAQFQTTKAQKEDIKKLVETINAVLDEHRLPDAEIHESFEVWWPKFEERLGRIAPPNSKPEPQRDIREILEDILGLVREQARTSQKTERPSDGEYEVIKVTEMSVDDARRLAKYFGYPSIDSMLSSEFIRDRVVSLLDNLREAEARGSIISKYKIVDSPKVKTSKTRKKAKTNENSDS